MKTTLLQQRIADAVQKHGSLRAAAAVLQMDYSYLSRLANGTMDNPSDDLLRRLKLRRLVVYEDTTKKKVRQ